MKYSVIIPAYNAEKTIEKCVRSISSQDGDYEIIIVNDGSEDSTGGICKTLAAENERIIFIDSTHEGVSRARNTGLDNAKGEYILFVDSDDYVSKNYFETIDNSIGDFDCLIFSKYKFSNNSVHIADVKPFESHNRDKTVKCISKLICNKVINSIFTKVYKRSIIEEHGIRFPETASMAEDKAFNVCYSLYINSMRVINEPLYYYNVSNPASLTRSGSAKPTGVDEYIYDAIEKSGVTEKEKIIITKALDFCRYRGVYQRSKAYARSGMSREERLKRIKKLCKIINGKKYRYPKTLYCLMICIPVKLKLATVIDFVGCKLL